MIQNIYNLYAVQSGASLIGGIGSVQIPTGIEVDSEPTSGQPYARLASIKAIKPSATFSTMHLKSAFDVFGALGKNIADLNGGLNFYARAHVNGGIRGTGSVNTKFTALAGLLLPRTLSVSDRENASLDVEAKFISADGSNAPLVKTDNVAVPAGLTDDERFTLGTMRIGGYALTGVKQFNVTFGLAEQLEGSDSTVYDTHASIMTVMAKLTWTGTNIAWAGTGVPLTGKAGTHADTVCCLRKRLANGVYVPDATAQHIKITAAGLLTVDDVFNGQNNQAGQCSVSMTCVFDGTNDPIKIDTAAVNG